jgi:hypothetical protein
MTEKTKSNGITSLYRVIVLGVLAWAGTTLESVRREVDVIKVQLADYRQSIDEKVIVFKADDARHETMLGEMRVELSRLRRVTPPKQTP